MKKFCDNPDCINHIDVSDDLFAGRVFERVEKEHIPTQYPPCKNTSTRAQAVVAHARHDYIVPGRGEYSFCDLCVKRAKAIAGWL